MYLPSALNFRMNNMYIAATFNTTQEANWLPEVRRILKFIVHIEYGNERMKK